MAAAENSKRGAAVGHGAWHTAAGQPEWTRVAPSSFSFLWLSSKFTGNDSESAGPGRAQGWATVHTQCPSKFG